MKKNDLIVIALVVLGAMSLLKLSDRVYYGPDGPPPRVVPSDNAPEAPGVPSDTTLGAPEGSTNNVDTVTGPETPETPDVVPPAASTNQVEEVTHILKNELLQLELSSIGAGIKTGSLLQYPKTQTDETPVTFDFSDRKTFAYESLPGFSQADGFEMRVIEEGRKVAFSKSNALGITLTRTYELHENYEVDVTDVFTNTTQEIRTLVRHDILMGKIYRIPNKYDMNKGVGVDALLQRGDGVKHYGGKLNKWLKHDKSYSEYTEREADWVATKNKFFCQILAIEEDDELGGARDFKILTARKPESGDSDDKQAKLANEVAAALQFSSLELAAGKVYERKFNFYLGPKKLSYLKMMPQDEQYVVELGWLAPISRALLWLLNYFHSLVNNYGVAIILLTIMIRLLFWPLTNKSNESMKKMQALGPEMKILKEKYKDNQQKQSTELMKLYKVHKVNPMSGCLPIMIQMPVFISLFYVIRAAVELRFGTFLWIDDLSEPEGLFKDVLPAVLGGLNVLPLAMAGTMFFQQKLSPAPADPAQAKIMKFFPVMLLFMLYKMPSGLMLYWTTSNLLMIGQQMLKLRQTDDDETPTIKNAVEHIPPTKAKKSGKKKKKK